MLRCDDQACPSRLDCRRFRGLWAVATRRQLDEQGRFRCPLAADRCPDFVPDDTLTDCAAGACAL